MGGIVGGFDSPARDLYSELAARCSSAGIAALHLRLRRPAWIRGSVADVRAGIRFLHREGIKGIALVGHSIGGAVVLQVARADPRPIRAVVCLSSLDLGGNALAELAPGCACLFVHGGRDFVLPSWFSVRLHARAAEPKRLLLLPRAGHRLTEARARVRREILRWLETYLAEARGLAA